MKDIYRAEQPPYGAPLVMQGERVVLVAESYAEAVVLAERLNKLPHV